MRFLVTVYGYACLYSLWPFVRFSAINMNKVPQNQSVIYVCNHTSFLDTYCMTLLPGFDFVFHVRSWPFKMIWYRHFMKLAKYIDVESLPWEDTVDRSAELMNKGAHVMCFPEGHRSRDGQLTRFYSGAFKLAVETGSVVVPLCVKGTDILWPPNRWWLQPCKVTLEALDPIDPKKFTGELGHVELRKEVKLKINDCLNDKALHDYVLHRKPMLHINKIVDVDEVISIVGSDNIFCNEAGELDSYMFVELIAQAQAVLSGKIGFDEGQPIEQGYLVGVRRFEINGQARVGDVLNVKVSTIGEFEEFMVIDGVVTRRDEVLATANIKVWATQ